MLRLTLIGVIAPAFVVAGSASACTCLPKASASEQASSADVIFLGRAESATRPRKGEVITTFKVTRTLKGEHVAVHHLRHRIQSPACGLTYTRGESYLVIAKTQGGKLGTNMCMAPRFPLSDFEAALRADQR